MERPGQLHEEASGSVEAGGRTLSSWHEDGPQACVRDTPVSLTVVSGRILGPDPVPGCEQRAPGEGSRYLVDKP